MNFLLLGNSESVRPILNAILADERHTIGVVYAGGQTGTEILTKSPGTRIVSEWEELLTDESIDAALVAGDASPVFEAAKQLAAAGCPLLILPSLEMGMSFVWELALLRDSSSVVLFPALPLRLDPQVDLIREAYAASDSVIQMRFEREVASKRAFVSVTEAEDHMLSDMDLLRAIGVEFNQVTALRSGVVADGATTFTLSLAGEDSPEAVWVLNRGDRDHWKLELIGGASNQSFEAPADSVTSDAVAHGVLKRFVSAIESGDSEFRWSYLTNAFELLAASRESIRRRRTIDVYYDTASERSLFKTQMTAAGCGVLLWMMIGMVIYLMVSSVAELPNWVLHAMRVVWLLPMVIFLVGQSLLLLTRPANPEAD